MFSMRTDDGPHFIMLYTCRAGISEPRVTHLHPNLNSTTPILSVIYVLCNHTTEYNNMRMLAENGVGSRLSSPTNVLDCTERQEQQKMYYTFVNERACQYQVL